MNFVNARNARLPGTPEPQCECNQPFDGLMIDFGDGGRAITERDHCWWGGDGPDVDIGAR